MYGTTKFGGTSTDCTDGPGCGAIYRVNADGGTTVLHSFSFTGATGYYPAAELAVGADGFMYGSAVQGGAYGWGTLFKLAADGTVTLLHSFNNADGAAPAGRLLPLPDGMLYGTTAAGGSVGPGTGCGTVFRFNPLTNAVDTLVDFGALGGGTAAFGCVSEVGLSLGADGLLYGATSEGGADNKGVIYRVSPSGANFFVVRELADSDGRFMRGEMVLGDDGAMYGTMQQYGGFMYGTAFRLKPNGQYTVLHRFENLDGRAPVAGLTRGTGGRFYGTTAAGGKHGCGTVFKMSKRGAVKTLRHFRGCLNAADGQAPMAPVFLDPSGVLWGTTALGGRGDFGTVFKLVPVP
jgi:uncharacterized repeat protein (TIGR03803 family)